MISRDKFVYNNGYGVTTDVYLLPVGTEFFVVNGVWRGKILEKNNKKMLYNIDRNELNELKEKVDYCLTIDIEREASLTANRQMGVSIEGAIFNYDGSDLDLFQLLEKLESIGLELGASTQPIDEAGDLYNYTDDWKTGEFVGDCFK